MFRLNVKGEKKTVAVNCFSCKLLTIFVKFDWYGQG